MHELLKVIIDLWIFVFVLCMYIIMNICFCLNINYGLKLHPVSFKLKPLHSVKNHILILILIQSGLP